MAIKGTGGFLNPEKILEQLNISDYTNAADFGCGRGYFSVPLAQKIPNGTVYALDVVEEALNAVRTKAKMANVTNIEFVRSNLEAFRGSKLDDESIDLVIVANILFQSQKKADILKEAKRVLKQSGKMIIIDWLINAPIAPKSGWPVSREDAQKLAEGEGLDLDTELDMDANHYGLVFKKSI